MMTEFPFRFQINHICLLFFHTVFIALVHVNCVKISSENDARKVNIEVNKHYAGMKTISVASIDYFGLILSRVLTKKSNSCVKYKIWCISNPNINVSFFKDFYG